MRANRETFGEWLRRQTPYADSIGVWARLIIGLCPDLTPSRIRRVLREKKREELLEPLRMLLETYAMEVDLGVDEGAHVPDGFVPLGDGAAMAAEVVDSSTMNIEGGE